MFRKVLIGLCVFINVVLVESAIAQPVSQQVVSQDGTKFILEDDYVAFEAVQFTSPTTVHGRVRAIGYETIHGGHVNYEVLQANGQSRERGLATMDGSDLSPKQHHPAYFTFNLTKPLQAGEKIRLGFE